MKWPLSRLFAAKENPKKSSTTRKISYHTLQRNITAMAQMLPVMNEWLDQEEIDRIDADASVIAAVAMRKASTLKKEILVEAQDTALGEALTKIFDFTFRQQALDIPLQGFGVFELLWYQKEGRWLPQLIERDYRDFSLKDGVLRYTPDDIIVPSYKAIYASYSPKFHKPMGRPLYQTLFWLTKFKNASIDFWLDYMERFSMPWVVGTTDGDKDEMAENLYAMLAGDVAVVGGEDVTASVELVTPDQKGDFHQLSSYADDQIREALIGSKLMGSAAGQSLAAAKEQNQVRADIAMTDAQILQTLIRQTLDAVATVNTITAPLSVSLLDEGDPKSDLATRDLNIHQMTGGNLRPTQAYLEETYAVKLEPTNTETAIPNRWIPNAASKGEYLQTQLPSDQETLPIEEALQAQIIQALSSAQSYEEAVTLLTEQVTEMDTSALEDLLSHYIANAHLYGTAEIEDENPEG